jgi:hypothetical protein
MKTMYRFLIGCLLIALIVGCTSNTILKKPDNLIPKEQMIDLIVDLLLADGGKNIRTFDMKRNINFYPQVFEKHQIDSIQFQESNYYYTSRIDDYDEILNAVELKLNTWKDEFRELKRVEDSIRRQGLDSINKVKRERKREIPKNRSIGNNSYPEDEIRE